MQTYSSVYMYICVTQIILSPLFLYLFLYLEFRNLFLSVPFVLSCVLLCSLSCPLFYSFLLFFLVCVLFSPFLCLFTLFSPLFSFQICYLFFSFLFSYYSILSASPLCFVTTVKWGDFDQWGEFNHLKLRQSFTYLFTSKLCLMIE